MIFQFDIDNTALQRLSDALDNPISGFKFVQGQGTLIQQKKKYMRDQVKELYKSIVFNSERDNAIKSEPLDTAAEQAKRFTDLGIVDTEI